MIQRISTERSYSESIEPKTATRLEPRYELKYVHDSAHLLMSDEQILGVHFPLKRSYPDRNVCNVYFDTIGLRCFAESLAGISRRTKLRIRWYGILHDAIAPTLEIKRRYNQVGTKEQFSIGDINLHDHTWSYIRSGVRGTLPAEAWRVYDCFTAPVLINSYRRSYFESLDGRLRLTIDRDLEFYDQRLRSRPNLNYGRQKVGYTIIEVKCSVQNRGLATTLTKRLGLRRVRMSKYCLGVEQLVG
jgi:hypothetical protein